MTPIRLILTRLGSAHRLTRQENGGPFAELGMTRSRTPI